MDLPFIGKLFTQERDSTLKSELVIMLRPRVINEGEWAEQEAAIKKRFPQFY